MVGITEIQINRDGAKPLNFRKYIIDNYPQWESITMLVESCMVPGLPKAYDEYSEPLDNYYKLYTMDIEKKLMELKSVLNKINSTHNKRHLMNADFICAMLLLTEEMKTKGPWYDQCYSKYSDSILDWFINKSNFCYIREYETQQYIDNTFSTCMRKIHNKLTKEKWKHHPAALNCYRNLIRNMRQLGKVACPLPLVFPGTLLQMDDFQEVNKVEGLKCCASLLRNLEHSQTGYEEVVYETLVQLLKYRKKCIAEQALECTLLILPLFSTQSCSSGWSKSDDIFEIILGELHLETDLERQIMYFNYLPRLIEISGNSAIRWKQKIIHLLSDNIDIYLNDSSDLRNLHECIKCFQVWLSVGWPVWKASTDAEILYRLYKLVFALSTNSNQCQRVKDCQVSVEKCIILVFSLCTKGERQKLLSAENVEINKLGKGFARKWASLKRKVNVMK